MKNQKVYILQKDLPDGKVGDEYILVDNLYYRNGHTWDSYWTPEVVEDNTDWFILKTVVPKVASFTEDENFIRFYLNKGFVEAISKERLAELLILNQENNLMTKDEVINGEHKDYSEKEYLEFGEECFNAARKNNSEWHFLYKSFSDFMNDKNKR